MKKQELTTAKERKMKFAEAGVMFVLVLALTVFVGIKVSTKDEGAELVTEPVVATEVVQPQTAVAVNDEAIAEHPDEVAAEPVAIVAEVIQPRVVTYDAAEKTFFDRRYDEAAGMFALYTDEHPANAWGFYMLGLSEWKAGDLDAAGEAFSHALEIKPDHAKSLVNYGRVLLAQGRLDEAREQVELSLAANPENLAATRVLGRIQYTQGQLDEAAASYRNVLSRDQEDVWSLNNLGLILIQQGRYEEALPALAKAVQIESGVAVFQNNLGVALERTGHFTAAGEAYAAALTADEGYEKADVSLARVSALTEDSGIMPVDLAALAASFGAADDMEVAAADPGLEVQAEDEFPVENPAPSREDNDTPRN